MRRTAARIVLLSTGFAAMGIGFQNCGGGLESVHTAKATAPRVLTATVSDPNDPALQCVFDGSRLANGARVTAYQTSTVPHGQTCVSESRQCVNGVLNGSLSYATCAPQAAAACLFNGATIPSGQSVVSYSVGSVAYGQSCPAPQTISCADGVLSGTNSYAACTVRAPTAANATKVIYQFSTGYLYQTEDDAPSPYAGSSPGYYLFVNAIPGAVALHKCQVGGVGAPPGYARLRASCPFGFGSLGVVGFMASTPLEGTVPLYEYSVSPAMPDYTLTHSTSSAHGGTIIGYVRAP